MSEEKKNRNEYAYSHWPSLRTEEVVAVQQNRYTSSSIMTVPAENVVESINILVLVSFLRFLVVVLTKC
jgi:hypothetical protein